MTSVEKKWYFTIDGKVIWHSDEEKNRTIQLNREKELALNKDNGRIIMTSDIPHTPAYFPEHDLLVRKEQAAKLTCSAHGLHFDLPIPKETLPYGAMPKLSREATEVGPIRRVHVQKEEQRKTIPTAPYELSKVYREKLGFK